jgi:DNA-binding transcriptional MocR family regulator
MTDLNDDHPDAPPMYVIIAKYYACKIADGEYKEDEILPHRTQIAEEFGVKPATAERGMRLLMHLGYAWPAIGGYKVHMPEEPVLPHGSLVPILDAIFHFLDSIKSKLESVESKIDLLLAAEKIPFPSPPSN